MIHLQDAALDRLVFRADLGSSSGQRALWFAGCRLKGSVLFVPDADMAALIRRCFLEKLRGVVTDLEICVCVAVAEPSEPKPKRTAWKKGKEPKQGEML